MQAMVAIVAAVSVAAAAGERIEVNAIDLSATNYLTQDEVNEVRKSGYLKGCGEADYSFSVARSGWYELWVEAAAWPTDLYLDGQFLIHTPFASGVWKPQGQVEKTLNLHLTEGRHTLRLSRVWHPGLPWMKRFFLEPAQDLSGMVRLVPQKDWLAFRLGESFPVKLVAGRQPKPCTLTLTLTDSLTGQQPRVLKADVPAGEGVYETTLTIPTDREGVFDLTVTDAEGRIVDRVLQFLVVYTRSRPQPPKELQKELIATIDCARQAPDYVSSGGTRVVEARFGSYRESGTRGRVEDLENADWFAYTLNLPSIQEPYLVEVDYPDDDERTFLISVIEHAINPYAPTLGVACGGEFPLSNQMQTHQLLFYPRQKDPRLFFQTWYRGQRAAAGRVRVHRLSLPFPALPRLRNSTRRFGLYQEEPLRFTSYFGAMPEGNTWANVLRPAERLGQWANYLGANLWHPTIAVYQSMMWPGKSIPGYAVSDEDSYGVVGPATLKEPFKKDLLRLMLLVSEKYGLDFVGELHIPANWVLMRSLDREFGGKGTYEDDGPQKPWLLISREGKTGSCPHYNPLYPGIQDWVASVLRELASRYKDSPAFKGVSLRLMGWQFSSWQTLPSIHWGYEDYTTELFEKETGVRIPVAADAPQRFARRYEWLMANAYEQWVDWRCKRVHAYHQRLAEVLRAARPDLTLHLDAYGPAYDSVFVREIGPVEYEEKGWLGYIREAGIDPRLYRRDANIVLNETRAYPPAIRTRDPLVAAADRVQFYDPEHVEAAAKPAGSGTVSAIHFDAQSLEGEMVRADRLGLPAKMMLHNKETAHGAGILNPAGRHALSRYANTLADGNIVFMHDGSHGHDQVAQPQYMREFLAEYHALPAIGMSRLKGSGDPVALWYGQQGNGWCFYLVNRARCWIEANVAFSGRVSLRRLSSGQAAPLGKDGRLHVSLKEYQLLGFGGGKPSALSVRAPGEVKSQLEKQIAFAERLLKGEGPAAEVTLVPFSLVDKQRATAKLAEARRACSEGRLVGARRTLMHPSLVKVCEAFGTYPPDLFHRKAPPMPEHSLSPQALLEKTVAEDTQVAKVVPASHIAPDLAGESALVWKDKPMRFHLETPLAGRFRLSAGYVNHESFGRPAFLLDGQPIPGQDSCFAEENRLWGRMALSPPVTILRGKHRLEVRPGKGGEVGLLHLCLEPVHRTLKANDWMIVGPFPSESVYGGPGPGMQQVFPPETARDATASYVGDGGTRIGWIHPASEGDYVNLHKLTGAFDWRVSYAVTDIESPEDRPAELRFGVDYWARIWLNSKVVFEETSGHGPPCKAQYTIPVQLRKGHNELLLKIHAGSAGNGFWISISDPGDLSVRPVVQRPGGEEALG